MPLSECGSDTGSEVAVRVGGAEKLKIVGEEIICKDNE